MAAAAEIGIAAFKQASDSAGGRTEMALLPLWAAQDRCQRYRISPDSPLEGDGFEPSVPRVGNYAHETALFDRHDIFRPFSTAAALAHTAKCLIAEGRLLGDNELRQIQELGSAVVMRRKEFTERCRANLPTSLVDGERGRTGCRFFLTFPLPAHSSRTVSPAEQEVPQTRNGRSCRVK